MPISVIVPVIARPEANYGIRPDQCPGFNRAMTHRVAAVYMRAQSEYDSERKAEMCVPLRQRSSGWNRV